MSDDELVGAHADEAAPIWAAYENDDTDEAFRAWHRFADEHFDPGPNRIVFGPDGNYVDREITLAP